jgi:hypothetical protein
VIRSLCFSQHSITCQCRVRKANGQLRYSKIFSQAYQSARNIRTLRFLRICMEGRRDNYQAARGRASPRSAPPLRMSVVMPNPGSNPALRSWEDSVQLPVINAWQDGLDGFGVVHNQMAVWNATTGTVDTRSGLPSRSSPRASPACR